jgi:hypothetical protein
LKALAKAGHHVVALFDGNPLSEQRGNDVIHSVAIYEAGQSFDTVADCTEAESAEYQKQNHFDFRVQLGINSWFPKSGFGVRAVLIEIDLSGRRLRGFGGTVFSKYDFQGFNCGRMHRFWLVRFFRDRTLGCEPRVAAEVEKRGENENTGHRYAGPASYHATHRAEGERIIREWLMNQRHETDR